MSSYARMTRASQAYALRIEGWGDATVSTATDKRFWLCSAPLEDDPDALCIDILDDYPSQIGSEVSLADRSLSGDALKFTLAGSAAILNAIRAVLCTVHHAPAARLIADVNATFSELSLDTSGLGESTVWIGREAVYLGEEDDPGVYRAGTRGVLGTQAQSHQVDGDSDVYVSPSIWEGRRVDLISYPTRGTYADAEVLWTGVITGREGAAEEIVVSCQSALQILTEAKICKRLWSGVVGQPDDLTNRFNGAGRPSGGTDATPEALLVFGEKLAARITYEYSASGDETNGAYTAFGGLTFDLNEGERYDLSEIAPGARIHEMYSTNAEAPPIRSTYTDASQQLSQNPIRFLQQILTTTETGGNGDWDLGVKDLGVGLTTGALNLDQWAAFADRYGSPEYRLLDLDLAFDGEPVEVMNLVHRVLGPLHLALCPTRDGIGVMGWQDQIPIEGGDGVITQAGHVGVKGNPSHTDYNGISAVDQVEVTWGKAYGGVGFQLDLTDETRRARYPYGEAGDLSVDASGYSRQFALTAGKRISQAYRTPPPIVTFRAGRDVLDVDCGALVDYSHPLLQGDSALGVDNLAVLVVGRKLNLGTHGDHETVDYTVALTGLALERAGRIANSAKVLSTSTAGSTVSVVVERSWFKDDASAPLHPDSSPWTTADRIDIRASDLSIKHADNEDISISSVLPNTPTGYDTITIKTTSQPAPVGVVAGDIVRHSREDDVGSDHLARFAWLADDDGALTSGRDAYVYGLETSAREGGSTNVIGWTAIDDEGAEEDGVLDEALLQLLASNIRTLANSLLSSSAVFLDAERPIRLHGKPNMMCVPVVWRKAEGVTEITITLLHTGHDADVEVWCGLLDAGGGVRRQTDRQTVEDGDEGELVFVIAGLQPAAATLTIAIAAESTLDTGSSVSIVKARLDTFAIEADEGRYLKTNDSLSVSGSGRPTLDDESVWLFHPGSDPEEGDVAWRPRLWLETSSPVGDNHYHWVWPVFSRAEYEAQVIRQALGTEDDLYWTPIGHARIYCIQIQDSESDAYVPDLSQYRAGLATSARSLGELASALEWTWRNRTTTLGMGGAVEREPFLPLSPSADALLPMGTVREYASSTDSVFQVDDEAWSTVWSAPVPIYPKQQDLNGNTSYLSAVQCAGLVGAWTRQGDVDEIDVWLRLSIYDESREGRVEGEILKLKVPAVHMAFDPNPFHNHGWLRMAAFVPPEYDAGDDQFANLGAHDARSLYPYSDTGNLAQTELMKFSLSVDDTEADAPTARRVQIEYMFAPGAPDLGYGPAPRLFFPAACAWIQRGIRGE